MIKKEDLDRLFIVTLVLLISALISTLLTRPIGLLIEHIETETLLVWSLVVIVILCLRELWFSLGGGR
jgi:hypothetical protein